MYLKPNILIFGGSDGSKLLNDLWILNIENAPYNWIKA